MAFAAARPVKPVGRLVGAGAWRECWLAAPSRAQQVLPRVWLSNCGESDTSRALDESRSGSGRARASPQCKKNHESLGASSQESLLCAFPSHSPLPPSLPAVIYTLSSLPHSDALLTKSRLLTSKLRVIYPLTLTSRAESESDGEEARLDPWLPGAGDGTLKKRRG